MIDLATARAIAVREAPAGLQVDETQMQEIRTGWFFPYRCPDPDKVLLGSKGLIVNKETGATFILGSAFSLERDLALYDKGYQFGRYDLVITKILDLNGTLDILEELDICTVEPSYENGAVWRIPRPLRRNELRSSLKILPHVFGGIPLYFRAEALECAREKRFFQFELLKYP